MGRLLRIVHEGSDLGPAEQELREQGFIREGIEFDPEALRVFLAPLAEPSRVERFRFSREWLRGEATRVADPRAANISRRLNLPPSYVLIHRVSTAGMGVLCQLESEGPFRAEMIRWMPGYSDADLPAGDDVTAAESTAGDVTAAEPTTGELITDEPAAEEITTAGNSPRPRRSPRASSPPAAHRQWAQPPWAHRQRAHGQGARQRAHC